MLERKLKTLENERVHRSTEDALVALHTLTTLWACLIVMPLLNYHNPWSAPPEMKRTRRRMNTPRLLMKWGPEQTSWTRSHYRDFLLVYWVTQFGWRWKKKPLPSSNLLLRPCWLPHRMQISITLIQGPYGNIRCFNWNHFGHLVWVSLQPVHLTVYLSCFPWQFQGREELAPLFTLSVMSVVVLVGFLPCVMAGLLIFAPFPYILVVVYWSCNIGRI